MHFLKKHYSFLVSLAILIVVVSGLFPFCHYYIDPDGTSYLTISERYASGDFQKAINGYWSPLSCWLTAIVINLGNLNAIPASIIVNTVGAAGILFIAYSFFLRFQVDEFPAFCLLLALSLFLSYAVYAQTFDDLWECFLLLISVRILVLNNFRIKPHIWVLYGLVGSLAYFAKAYSFPFFILNTVVCLFAKTRGWKKENRTQYFSQLFIALLSFFLACTPWIIALTTKYQAFTTSFAGSLNLSWYVAGHPFYKEGIDILLPPVYETGHYYWEDPSVVNGATPHFWSSLHMLQAQIIRAGYNVLKCVSSMNELSAFFIVTSVLAIVGLSKPMRYLLPHSYKMVAIPFLLFPLGFVLINYESRYIWFAIVPSMITGALFISHYLGNKEIYIQRLVIVLFAASFVVFPMYNIRTIVRQGKTEYDNALKMKENNVRGSFAAGGNVSSMNAKAARLAWFSDNAFYVAGKEDYAYHDLLKELRRYRIKYFIYFYTDAAGSTFSMKNENGEPFPEATGNNSYNGMKIFTITPHRN